MAKTPAVTFKNDKALTGLAAVGNSPGCTIKCKTLQVGVVSGRTWHHSVHKVRLMVKDDTNGCGWKWVTLKYSGDSLNGTKEWVKANWAAIYTKYDLYYTEPF